MRTRSDNLQDKHAADFNRPATPHSYFHKWRDLTGITHFRNVIVARSGIMRYFAGEIWSGSELANRHHRSDDKIYVCRQAECFGRAILNSASVIPVTLGHPSDYFRVQKSKSYFNSELRPVGAAANYRVEKTEKDHIVHLVCDITLWDEEVLSLYRSKKLEISLGSESSFIDSIDAEPQCGLIEDIVRIDHNALVDKGRAGPIAVLHHNKPLEEESMKETFNAEIVKSMTSLGEVQASQEIKLASLESLGEKTKIALDELTASMSQNISDLIASQNSMTTEMKKKKLISKSEEEKEKVKDEEEVKDEEDEKGEEKDLKGKKEKLKKTNDVFVYSLTQNAMINALSDLEMKQIVAFKNKLELTTSEKVAFDDATRQLFQKWQSNQEGVAGSIIKGIAAHNENPSNKSGEKAPYIGLYF